MNRGEFFVPGVPDNVMIMIREVITYLESCRALFFQNLHQHAAPIPPQTLSPPLYKDILYVCKIISQLRSPEPKIYFYNLLWGAFFGMGHSGDGQNFEDIKNYFFRLCPDVCQPIDADLHVRHANQNLRSN